jgi:hypothetical protein
MKYWQLVADMSYPNRWLLGALTDIEGKPVPERQFTQGRPASAAQSLRLSVAGAGNALDFTHGPMDLLVVRPHVANLLESIEPNAVQRVPVVVDGQSEQFEILNVVVEKDCIDRKRSKIRVWTAEDGFPILTGKYKAVDPLTVDPVCANGFNIFRISGWTVALIVSERIRSVLAQAEITGIRFQAV